MPGKEPQTVPGTILRDESRVTLRTHWPVLAGAVASLVLSILFVELTHMLDLSRSGHQGVFILVGLVCLILPLATITNAIRRVFRGASSIQVLRTILLSYFAMLLAFTGVYYALNTVGDLHDAVEEYEFYRAQVEAVESGGLEHFILRVKDERNFDGFNSRIWTSVEYRVREKMIIELHDLSVEELIVQASKPIKETVRFNPGARIPVLLECFHLSVITTTTVGYGDIIPIRPLSRLVTDLQALASVILMVLGLGLTFSGWFDLRSHKD